ncbi:uncharacterized protein ATC70_009464 [Mucor velutinosus]|uniref:RNA polymerase II elongation factor ELL N-terminal domain-containing protein n=1 Tax=Mucor velutinosus TaxID=708070 RepID=A0AAN7I3C4_9FUNG|nr:hypothetical protein ATC70_009464 [Mucor velutinosus]
MAGEKIINFKLDAHTIEKLTKQKSLHVAYRKSGVLELVMDDARIRLDTMKGSKSPRAADATYYNNNSSTLHYLGDTVVATPIIRKIQEEKKPKAKDSAEQRDKVTRLLDIPSTTATSTTAPETKSKTTSSLKKPSSNKKSKPTNSIPPTPTTPLSASSSSSRATQKTLKSSKSFDPAVTKTTAPSEEKYSMKSRILQRLAIQPWSLIEMTKSLNRSQLERCEQLEVKHILDMVAFPIKKDERKKFCLKPKHYKDIQIWTWPFYSNEDKKIAAENAKEAYDLLQSQGVDSDRSNLYHPDSPYKPPAMTSPMLANGKKIASPLSSRKTSSSSSSSAQQQQQQQEKGKGRLTPVDHASPSTPLMKLAASPLQNKPITPTPPSATMTPPPLPSSSQSTPTQHYLKPSSANKKYGSKALPQQNGTTTSASTPTEKLSPPTKRKNMMMDDVDVPSQNALVMPTPRHKKRAKESSSAAISSTPTPPISKSSKMALPTSAAPTPAAATPTMTTALPPPPPSPPTNKEPTSIKPLNIKSQHKFNAYCHSYVKQQKDYIRIKRFFKSNFPQYIQVLQATEPPKGTKRSYYDLNAEYQAMLKSNYLKQGDDEQAFKEAQDFLVDCNNKRRRLNYMWTSIKQNLDEHQYTIPKNLCK